MVFTISMPARVIPLVFYSVAALRVAEGQGSDASSESHEDDDLHSGIITGIITDSLNHHGIDESLAMPHANMPTALLTKMRATLLKKKSDKSKKYNSGVEVGVRLGDSLVVQNATGPIAQHSTSVRNSSAVPMGAAPLHFQHADQSEFQGAPHQAVLPSQHQDVLQHMIDVGLQSPESKTETADMDDESILLQTRVAVEQRLKTENKTIVEIPEAEARNPISPQLMQVATLHSSEIPAQQFNSVRNISAVPMGADHPFVPHAHMIDVTLQSPEIPVEQARNQMQVATLHSPEIPAEEQAQNPLLLQENSSKDSEGQQPEEFFRQQPGNTLSTKVDGGRRSKTLVERLNLVGPDATAQNNMESITAKPSTWFTNNHSKTELRSEQTEPVMLQIVPGRVQGSQVEPAIQNYGVSNGDIHIKLDLDLDVRLQNNTLRTEIDSVNDSVIEPRTWMPAPNKEPMSDHLLGKPFVEDPFNPGRSSTVQEKEFKVNAEEPSVRNSSREAIPLPPKTLYGKPAETEDASRQDLPLPPRTLYGQGARINDSFALVDSSASVGKISAASDTTTTKKSESQRGLEQDAPARTTEVKAASTDPEPAPAPAKRASVVRRWSPDTSTTKTVTESSKYYPGHWGSEAPAILREPKDDVIRKQMQEPVWTILITIVLLLSVMVLLFCAVPLKSMCCRNCMSRDENEQKSMGEVRRMVETYRVTTMEDINSTFKPRGGYDCLLLQPQNPGIVVRIQGVVVASQQAELRAPITRKKCVLFSTSALERRLDGVVAPPQAFHSMAINFAVELNPHMKLHIQGQDVALFDMVAGRHEENVVLREASNVVQDFMRSYRTPFFGARDTDFLEFQERFLEVGAKVTCVGEVRRSENGELGLWPIQHNVPAGAVPVSANFGAVPSRLTSWERLGSAASGESGESAAVEKVMISDDPQLLS